jgi:fumarate hydratase subunit alpha
MAITDDTIRTVAATLYERSLKKVPEDTKEALRRAVDRETNETAREVLRQMIRSAEAAEDKNWFMCSDSGIPVYFVKIGTGVRIDGDIRDAISQGFENLVQTMTPPLLPHVTDPLTLERSYAGKGVPVVSFDLIPGADYIELTCSPKGLGSGRWAALQVLSFPSIETMENYILECVVNAGPQSCPPVIVGVGIGGTFDMAAKMAKEAMLRPLSRENGNPYLRDWEAKILKAVNATGIGPMGTGGDTTALAVHIEVAAGHGFIPVAVCFNCWPNRRLSARIFNGGAVEYFE